MDMGKDGRSTGGQFTSYMHQRAREAEAAGRQRLTEKNEDADVTPLDVTPNGCHAKARAPMDMEQHDAQLDAETVLHGVEANTRADFVAWLCAQGIEPLEEEYLDELLCDWRMTSEYQATKAVRIAESCRCDEEGRTKCTHARTMATGRRLRFLA